MDISLPIGNRDIGTEEMKIKDFVNKLAEGEFLIPSFQREFVWNPEDIIKLWDSIYRFYPIGSILYWKTDIYLNVHRKLGGCILWNDNHKVRKGNERVYILDGQQRTTSLLISLSGRKIRVKNREQFDYSLYFDATTATFFFAEAFNRRSREVNKAFLIRLGDVLDWDPDFYKGITSESEYPQTIGNNLRQLSHVFEDYKMSCISLRGFDIPAVREIFERINQEGKDLKPMDLMIARTFQNYAYLVEEDI